MMLAISWYRVRQFAKATRAGLNTAEQHEIAEVLAPPFLSLFRSMNGIAQRHGYDVFETLRSRGYSDPDLLAAALLHDVGKGRVGVASRVLWVLLGKLLPGLRAGIAERSHIGRWLGLWHNLHHPALGSELVADAGGSLITIWLIRHHDLTDHVDPLLRALQLADDDN